jgi:CDP-diacylglycerol--serine O-phosphatidyltransferase
VFGITQAVDGRYRIAVLCLALSGLCDMFDGKIARTKKDRTEDEKAFGIQIDSLCDVVCFGIFPIVLCYVLGVRGILGTIALIVYGVCSVIRLAYFNVLEEKRQQSEGGANKYYHGLPITTMAIVLPLVFMLNIWIPDCAFRIVLFFTLLVVGILFVVDFKLKKPNNLQLTALVTIVAVAVIATLLLSHYHIVRSPIHDQPLIEWIVEKWMQ